MALISKIRKQGSWVLVVLIALGLGGFILMDMTTGQTSIFGSARTILGKINGEKLDINEFNRTESILYSGSAGDIFARRENLWNYFVEKALVQQEAGELGIGVSKTELLDLEFGPEPSPIIMQRFGDPFTGQINRDQLNQIKQQIESNTMDPQLRSFWRIQEEEIIKDRMQSKLITMVAKGMYTPTWQAEMFYNEQAQYVNLEYVLVPFDEVENNEVSVSEDDYAAYIKENAKMYTYDKEQRRIGYVVFDVQPSGADSAALRDKMTTLVSDFTVAENDTTFIERNQGSMNAIYQVKSEVSPIIADTVFQMSVGEVYGPYIDGSAFKAVKLLDRRIVPDSVRSRHILISAQDPTSLLAAQQRIDSIKTAIEAGGTTFAEMATKYGSDATKDKGGDLGYAAQGQMVQAFNDLIFYTADQGKLYTVQTQFGAHLVEVTGKKFIKNEPAVRLGFLSENIVPSDETQKKRYDEALSFQSSNKSLDDIKKVVEKNKTLTLETSSLLDANGYFLGSLGSSSQTRDIVRWAFKSDEGDVSPQVYVFTDPNLYYDSRYVVTTLMDIVKPGLAKVGQVKSDIESAVVNRKKGELISAKLKGKDLAAAAAAYSASVDTVLDVRFNSSFIPNIGAEPKLLGAAFRLDNGKTSAPIVGNGGVYVIKVTDKSQPSVPSNLPALRRTLETTLRSQVNAKLMEVLREKASIADNRAKFF